MLAAFFEALAHLRVTQKALQLPVLFFSISLSVFPDGPEKDFYLYFKVCYSRRL